MNLRQSSIQDAKGRSFVWNREVDPVRNSPCSPASLVSGNSAAVQSLSDRELNEVLRPMVYHNGHEYTVERPLDLAARIRKPAAARTQAGSPRARSATEKLAARDAKPLSGVINGDNRAVRRDNTAYPWSTVVYSGCSATMIGPSTLLTAAHCVHNGTDWLSLPLFSPGVDCDDPQPYPFGQFGTYTVTIPAAYVNRNGGDSRFDYAVVEFSGAGSFPGRTAGWKGIWVAPDEIVTGNTLSIYGHPSDKKQPQIWGADGTGSVSGDFIETKIDAWYGESGSGIYTYDTDGWPYVIGVLLGGLGTIGNDADPNFGRRITQDVFSFVVEYSAL